MSCIFCKIVNGDIPAARVYEDAETVVIRDIQPQASTHLLVLPKKHVASLDEAFPAGGSTEGRELAGRLLETAVKVARQEGLLPGGFRTVINTGAGGGQTVFHLHMHVLGGGSLSGSFG